MPLETTGSEGLNVFYPPLKNRHAPMGTYEKEIFFALSEIGTVKLG